MARKTTTGFMAGMLLVASACCMPPCLAQEWDGDCDQCQHGHHAHHRRNDDGRTCCQRIWGWWTYRPLPVPHHLKGCIRFQQTPQAPYYAYFTYLYGPRSPNLGYRPTPVHRGEVCAHGLPPDMSCGDIPLDGTLLDRQPKAAPTPEEALPIPRINSAPAVADPGVLPNEAPEESEATTVPVRDVNTER